MSARFLTALPVFNEVGSVSVVLDEVAQYSDDILVVDDGSTDGTLSVLRQRQDIALVQHSRNRGYGAALMTAFEYAANHQYDLIVTIDCDGQHEPQRIRQFIAASDKTGADIVSGSRYRRAFDDSTLAPAQRMRINLEVTRLLNQKLGYELTDAFCGFKAYRVAAIKKLRLNETGYAMPLQLWVQAWCHRLTVVELAVPLIYLDASRSFGETLDDPQTRMKYYRQVLADSLAALGDECPQLRHGKHLG